MIWGMSYDDQRRYLASIEQWRPYFAWFPVRLDSGRTAWLQTVERYGWGYVDGHTTFIYRERQP